jgi:hypothetical protein
LALHNNSRRDQDEQSKRGTCQRPAGARFQTQARDHAVDRRGDRRRAVRRLGHAIAAAGPAAIVAYALAGTLVVLVMRMLGDGRGQPRHRLVLHLRRPAIGRWAGFTIGWLYWWFWVLVIPIEAMAAGVC